MMITVDYLPFQLIFYVMEMFGSSSLLILSKNEETDGDYI